VQRSFDADGIFIPLKRDKSRRTVKLTLQTVEALKLHRMRQYKERLRAAKWEDHGLVFPNRVGKPMDHNNLYHRDFNSLLKRAGLWSENKDKRITFTACATPHVRHPASLEERQPEDRPGDARSCHHHADHGHLLARSARHGRCRYHGARRRVGLIYCCHPAQKDLKTRAMPSIFFLQIATKYESRRADSNR
jgi:hypothetical protein